MKDWIINNRITKLFIILLHYGSGQQSEQVSEQVLTYRNKVLDYCFEPKTAKEIRKYINLKSRNYVNDKIIKPLISLGKLQYTNYKNHVSNQKYITIKDVDKNDR